jgi:hypothetical protein
VEELPIDSSRTSCGPPLAMMPPSSRKWRTPIAHVVMFPHHLLLLVLTPRLTLPLLPLPLPNHRTTTANLSALTALSVITPLENVWPALPTLPVPPTVVQIATAAHTATPATRLTLVSPPAQTPALMHLRSFSAILILALLLLLQDVLPLPFVSQTTVEAATENIMILKQRPRFAMEILAQLPTADLSPVCLTINVLMEALLGQLTARDKQMVLVDGPSNLALAILKILLPTAPSIAHTATSFLLPRMDTQPLMELLPTVPALLASAKCLLLSAPKLANP